MTRREFDRATKENHGGPGMTDQEWRAYRRQRRNIRTASDDWIAQRAAVVAATGIPTLSKASCYRRKAERARDLKTPLL